MRIAKNLQRLSDGGTGYSLVLRDQLMKAAAYILDLEAKLREVSPNLAADFWPKGEMDPHKENQ